MSRKVKNNGVQNTNKTETCENICLNVLQEFRKFLKTIGMFTCEGPVDMSAFGMRFVSLKMM